jgi:tRNA threonylcarbamoyladenosine modification (KEOPS) complex  Pcc1 subunit
MFDLKVSAADPAVIRAEVESVLRRYDIRYELRSAGAKELVYEALLPLDTKTDRVSNAILMIDSDGEKEVVWDEKKKK